VNNQSGLQMLLFLMQYTDCINAFCIYKLSRCYGTPVNVVALKTTRLVSSL